MRSHSAALIERREYKYITDEATVDRIRLALMPFCTLDSHGAQKPNGRYVIDSLYCDTPRFDLFAANQRKLVDRFKIRIRTYPGHNQVYLEVKRRYNDVISKTRGALPAQAWSQLLSDPAMPIPAQLKGYNRMAVERFLALYQMYQAGPVAIVRYDREAWVSQIDDYARITFDRQIRSLAHEQLSLDVGERGFRRNDNAVNQKALSALTVVEFKFTSAVPRWMMSIVQSCNLYRSSFSKYGTSILTWHLAPVFLNPTRIGVAA